MHSLGTVAELLGERPGLLDDDRSQLGDPARREPQRRAGDAERGDRAAGLVEHRRGDRAEAELELVDRGGEALAADRLPSSAASSAGSAIVREVSASSGPSAAPAAANASSTLPLAEQWYGHAAADPVARAEVVAALDLREVLDAAGRRRPRR